MYFLILHVFLLKKTHQFLTLSFAAVTVFQWHQDLQMRRPIRSLLKLRKNAQVTILIGCSLNIWIIFDLHPSKEALRVKRTNQLILVWINRCCCETLDFYWITIRTLLHQINIPIFCHMDWSVYNRKCHVSKLSVAVQNCADKLFVRCRLISRKMLNLYLPLSVKWIPRTKFQTRKKIQYNFSIRTAFLGGNLGS